MAYSEATKRAWFNFLISKYGASRYVLLDENEVLCNQTGYTLLNPSDGRWSGTEASCDIQRGDDSYILIMGKRIPDGLEERYRLVLIEDISEVHKDIRDQAYLSGSIFFGAALAAVLIIFIMTRKILSPLKELQQAAEDISAGSLKRRVHVRKKDETGELALAFNAMAERIESQVSQLEQVSEQRMRLLGSLTHELKTPMTSIIGYSDTLLNVNLKEVRRMQALRHINEECRRLERLSGKLMNLIGMYDNNAISLEETDTAEVFRHVEELEKYRLMEMGITLEIKGAIGTRKLDRDLFESLLINLIDNAAKASAKGQTIFLEGSGNTVTVRDCGRGIPKEEVSSGLFYKDVYEKQVSQGTQPKRNW